MFHRYGLVDIDSFTNTACICPLKSKTPDSMSNGTKDMINKNTGKPEQFYNDQEKTFQSAEWSVFIIGLSMKHLTSTTSAHTVERFNRTLKTKTCSAREWHQQIYLRKNGLLRYYRLYVNTTTRTTEP